MDLNLKTILNISNAPKNTSKWRKLYHQLKTAILNGSLNAGYKLPSSRKLAQHLNVSRNTIIITFEQLIAEGYLISKQGSGTYIADISPDEFLSVPQKPMSPIQENKPLNLSQRGIAMCDIKRQNAEQDNRYLPFLSGLPDLAHFPKTNFAKILSSVTKSLNINQLDYDFTGGIPSFKKAIAQYLATSRGVICKPEQVLIITGSQAALDLTARLLVDSGDNIWFENPGYGGALSAFLSAGAITQPLPVINNQHDFKTAIDNCPNPKLAYVTPSHQYPTGITMSLKDRQTLLKLATERDFWIIEDDYDSEYRYEDHPLAALQGLDKTNRTIYIGTFSKILSPSLRCAYLVLPPDLVKPFNDALFNSGMMVPSIIQLALTEFINSGQFASHIRKMRIIYSERREILLSSIETHLSDYIAPLQTHSGMAFAVRIIHPKLQKIGDIDLSEHLAKHNLICRALSSYALTPALSQQQGLLLGFAPFNEQQLEHAAQKMAKIFTKLTK